MPSIPVSFGQKVLRWNRVNLLEQALVPFGPPEMLGPQSSTKPRGLHGWKTSRPESIIQIALSPWSWHKPRSAV